MAAGTGTRRERRMVEASRTVRLADGRTLAWDEYGEPGGRPVFAFHGSPSSRLDFAPTDDAARRHGLRLIAPDRPGIGGSSPAPGRTLAGWADDVAALADHLGIGRFAVLGFSGGGPYALACAVELPERVDAVVGASAAGPIDYPGGQKGMGLADRWLTLLSLRAPRAGRAWMRLMEAGAVLAPTVVVKGQAMELGPGAGPVIAALGPPSTVLAPFHESVRQGPAGAVEDFAVVSRPWGLDLGTVTAPVQLFHGGADRVVPLHQARYLADHIPGAELIEIPAVGHILLYRDLDRVLAAVAATPPAEG